MSRNTTSDDTDESLTHVDADDLTDHELRNVIPSCDFVVVGYDSSYSDADVSRKRVVDPEYDTNTFRHIGPIAGTAADDPDRGIGFGTGQVETAASSGRIGTTLFVEYPAPEPDKTRYTVTFRALAGNWSSAPGDYDDPEYVNDLTESTVDEYSYDDVEMPPESERRIEDVPVRPLYGGGVRTHTRTVVDVPVTLTIADVDTTDRDDVVERARDQFKTSLSSWYHPLTRREDLPDVHSDENEGPSTGPSGMGRSQYVRENTRYFVEDIIVDAETV